MEKDFPYKFSENSNRFSSIYPRVVESETWKDKTDFIETKRKRGSLKLFLPYSIFHQSTKKAFIAIFTSLWFIADDFQVENLFFIMNEIIFKGKVREDYMILI